MKEQLIKVLNLDEKSTEEQIVEAVKGLVAHNANLKDAVEAKIANEKYEKAIQAKIRESGGALSREQAIEVLSQQVIHNAKAKK